MISEIIHHVPMATRQLVFPQAKWIRPEASRQLGHLPGLPLGADPPGGRGHGVSLGEARGAAVRLQRKGGAPGGPGMAKNAACLPVICYETCGK